MKHFIFTLQSVVKIVFERKVNTALIAVVMTVSIICSLFLVSYGYQVAKDSQENNIQARIWYFYTETANIEQTLSLRKKLNDNNCLYSLIVAGKSQTLQYIGGKETPLEINVACELHSEKLLTTATLGTIRFSFGNEAVITKDGFIRDYLTIGTSVFNVIAYGFHSITPFIDTMFPIYAFISKEAYENLSLNTETVIITLKQALNEDEHEDFLSFIDGYIHFTDVIAPFVPQKKSIEATQLFTAFLLLCLSFINVYSIFLYLSQKRKKEYEVYHVCGASRYYVFFDILTFVVLLTGVFFILSCLLYSLFSPLLKGFNLYYPINAYVILMTLLLIAFPASVVIMRLERSVNRK
jgi:hypothetical protein